MVQMSFLNNGTITLRAPEPEDLEVMYNIENNPELWKVGCTTVPYSRYVLRQYIENSTNDIFADRQIRLMVERNTDRCILGSVDLTGFEPLHNRAEIGLVVSEQYRSEGVGKQALKMLCDYGFNFLHLHQLYAYVAVDSIACLQMFYSCGFTKQMQLKEWIRDKDGGYKDAMFIQCFSDK